jgi:hypothetical protein
VFHNLGTEADVAAINDFSKIKHVSEPSGGCRATKHGHESLKIAGHSPFDEPILRRYFSLLDCAARTQSGAKQSGRLRGVVETTLSRRIASHSAFDWTGNCTGLAQRRNSPDDAEFPDATLRRVCIPRLRRTSSGQSDEVFRLVVNVITRALLRGLPCNAKRSVSLRVDSHRRWNS